MTDPSDALTSFQQALIDDEIKLQRGQLDPELFVLLDHPNGEPRFTYVRLKGRTVTALVILVLADPLKGTPCFQIGCAVPNAYRNQGRAKDAVEAAIAELKHGLARNKISTFYVEAVVGTHNEPSQRVAAATISAAPAEITDEVSGLPALHYLRKIGEDA
jgi:hypothetical protein